MTRDGEHRPRRSRSRSRSRSPRGARSDHRDRDRDRDRDRTRHRSRSRNREGERRRDDRRGRTRSRSRSPKRSRRSRSRSADRTRDRKKARRSRSRSASNSSSDSDSDVDRKHRKRRKRSRSRSRSRERRKHKDKDEKKKKSKSKKSKALTTQWGKYGLISDTDLYTKDAEFRAWLLEEQKVNPETVSKDQTRRLFSKFVEDYNTGTLPSEKYYHLEKYESRMDLLRRGETLPEEDSGYNFAADIASHGKTIKAAQPVTDLSATYSRAEVEELRRLQRERVEVGKMKVLGMDIKTNMGVRMADGDE